MKKQITKCPDCKNTAVKYGKRKNKLQEIQIYSCKSCNKRFSLNAQQNKTYPINLILKAVSTYNLGYTLQQTQEKINNKHKLKIPVSTLSNWLSQYKQICTYSKLRKQAIKHYTPKDIIFSQRLQHNQIYNFQYHKAKLQLLFNNIKYNNQFTNISKFQKPITNYLNKIPTKSFPHHIFRERQEKQNSNAKSKFSTIDSEKPAENLPTLQSFDYSPSESTNKNNLKNKNNVDKKLLEKRASQLKFKHLKITQIKKQNLANKLTNLVLNLANNNQQRHQIIQNFFLTNDSTTIATEVPVYLTHDDIIYFKKRGFKLDLQDYKTPITGHIDILQIRNSLIHILDYKPEADKNQPIEQLTLYALALASKTKLDLHSFKSAWFDEISYHEFFPLHVVKKKAS